MFSAGALNPLIISVTGWKSSLKHKCVFDGFVQILFMTLNILVFQNRSHVVSIVLLLLNGSLLFDSNQITHIYPHVSFISVVFIYLYHLYETTCKHQNKYIFTTNCRLIWIGLKWHVFNGVLQWLDDQTTLCSLKIDRI